MKTLFKAIAIASLASTAAVAQAEVTGTLGVNSSYMFRGEQLADGNTTYASAGMDLAGFSVGITVTDNDGVNGAGENTETDLYVGYGMNLMGTDVRLSYTSYEYDLGASTVAGDEEGQTEFAVGITASGLSIDYVDGEDTVATDYDYTVLTLGYTVGNVDIVVGNVDRDNAAQDEWNYYEISTGTELFGLDASVTVTNTFSEEGNGGNSLEGGATIVVGVSKSLSL